jgi:hypothetical protein
MSSQPRRRKGWSRLLEIMTYTNSPLLGFWSSKLGYKDLKNPEIVLYGLMVCVWWGGGGL